MKKGEITNKFLIILLIIAMITSLGGTFISLGKLGKIEIPYITGHAETDTGEVKIQIASLLSISIVGDGSVDYGTCWPPISGGKYFDSTQNLYNPGTPGFCNVESWPQGITVMNDGNIHANVTVQTDDWELVSAANTSLWFKTYNSSTDPGCFGAHDWTNFTQINTEYPGCDNLTNFAGPSRDKFDTAFRIWVPSIAAPGEDTATITFTAHGVT